MLTVTNLSYACRHQKVLDNLSFNLKAGQTVCVLGKNGVGKSTLFKCLLNILQPTSGTITINGQATKHYSRNELAQQIAYIPQKPLTTIDFTVFEMVLMGAAVGLKSYQQPKKTEIQRVEETLTRLKISHLKNQPFSAISGGEQQLVIIARSIAQQSKILIMDEPCANLDYGNQIMVLKMSQSLAAQGYLVIQSTHDPNHALQYAQQVLVLKNGCLKAQGPPAEILTSQQLEEIYQVPIAVHQLDSYPQQICLPK
ncbi:ABC transporter ATP-binding protein [Enterococcus faecalis]